MSERSFKIVVSQGYQDQAITKLRRAGRVTILGSHEEAALIEAVKDADALVVRTRSPVTRTVMEAAKSLRVIGRGGVGLDNIDLDAAREQNITVVYTPHSATDAVADLAVGMMIALTRRFAWADQMVRQGRFSDARSAAYDREMHDLTLGIVGMGRIGRAVARRCRNGLGMTVLYNDIREAGFLDVAASCVSKEHLYAHADILSLHVPLTSRTRHLIGKNQLKQFKSGAILINTARGPVVDNVALAAALQSGKLGGAGLDVFETEPISPPHPLLSAPNTILTPHIGARTDHGLSKMDDVVDDVLGVLDGKPPRCPATL